MVGPLNITIPSKPRINFNNKNSVPTSTKTIHSKGQLYENNSCLFWDSYKIYKHILWARCSLWMSQYVAHTIKSLCFYRFILCWVVYVIPQKFLVSHVTNYKTMKLFMVSISSKCVNSVVLFSSRHIYTHTHTHTHTQTHHITTNTGWG